MDAFFPAAAAANVAAGRAVAFYVGDCEGMNAADGLLIEWDYADDADTGGLPARRDDRADLVGRVAEALLRECDLTYLAFGLTDQNSFDRTYTVTAAEMPGRIAADIKGDDYFDTLYVYDPRG